MIYTYNISFKNHVKNSWTILIYFIVSLIFPFYMIYRFGSKDTGTYILLATVLFLLFLIPQMIIHLNYYFVNKGDVLFYDPDHRKITIDRKGVSHSFSFDDIDFIEWNTSYPLAENRSQWLPWDSYNHSIIKLKNGRKFVITSLLIPNMELPITSGKIKLKKSFYRTASAE